MNYEWEKDISTWNLGSNNQIIIYQTDDDQTQIDVRLENETVWLTQAQMAELFQTDHTSIVRHINKIYADDELDRDSTCAKIAQVQKEGNREVIRQVEFYSLDVILSVVDMGWILGLSELSASICYQKQYY